jgi:hypothetical protein
MPFLLSLMFSELEKKRAEQDLPGSKVGGDEGEGRGRQGGKMTQTMYTHMNKQ